MPGEKNHKKKIGLALGAGAARGLAHIGILKILNKYKIPINAISGTSMGALIGGLYASGLTPEELEEIALSINWLKILQMLFPTRIKTSRFLSGTSIEDFVHQYSKFKKIEELPIPFFATATDIWSGKEFVFETGDLGKAIRASASFPFLFSPVTYNNKILVDGGLVDPVPVGILHQKGYDLLICSVVTPPPHRRKLNLLHRAQKSSKVIDISYRISEKYSPNIYTFLQYYMRKYKRKSLDYQLEKPNIRKQLAQVGNIMEHRIMELSLQLYSPQIVINPDISSYQFFDFLKVKEIILRGEEAATKILPQLEQLLNE